MNDGIYEEENATRPAPSQRISEDALTVWRFKGMIEMAIVSFIPFALLVLAFWFGWSEWVRWALGAILVFLVFFSVWYAWVLPKWQWQRWRYEVYETEVELQYGVIISKHVLIPMVRVQHVDTAQGPIYKRYGLSTVTISTAAGMHEIPALKEETAPELRNRIAFLAGTDDDDE
ncbi:PH domain-containing protein [Marinococcus sp. PL1-022]|uniref:PH domain-containing protein n=1 Tax=Marinococcus sp. PL1-022 TaxID=3095363 RepID=UPI0029C24EED|nr:PH domain-containing protein [Marinococcus sp. PL1-022]MDX6152951.1 PH domain-containing protein [Marinococcus sp. PL1-022]